MKTIEGEVAAALIAERKRARAIFESAVRFGVATPDVEDAIRRGTTAEEFAQHHEIETLARQIANA